MAEPYVILSKKKFAKDGVQSFEIKIKGQIVKGFVIEKNGQYFAYQNLCRHLPVTLDLADNRFFNFEHTYLQCHMHGAMYEVETGFCVAGPCQGARLIALPLQEEGSRVIVRVPEDLPES